jgi:hypothetical protein
MSEEDLDDWRYCPHNVELGEPCRLCDEEADGGAGE